MSIERLYQELNIAMPTEDWAHYKYTWGGKRSGKTAVRLGVSTNGNVFWISSWGGLMFRAKPPIPHSMLSYDELKENFLKYVALLKPGEIPALDHLIPNKNWDKVMQILTTTKGYPPSIKADDPEPEIKITTPVQILKPGPTHDWISALYRPYIPIV